MGRQMGVFVALLLFALSAGCSREISSEKIRLVIPMSGNSSSLAAGDMMRSAIVNIQVPGQAVPIVREYDFDNNPIPWGTPLDLVVDNVPSGPGLFIQFLGVFDTAAGASYLITYGDVIATVAKGTTVVNLVATPAGTASKEGRVAGRYFNSSTSGPTGALISYFSPPNGKPKMAVNKSQMVNGWFNTMVLDNIPMTTAVLESGITIFSNLTIGSPALATGTHMMKIDTAAHYRREERENSVSIRPQVPGSFYLGYFKDANGPTFSGYRSCYLSGQSQGLPGWYGVYAAQTLSNPLIYSPTPDNFAGITIAGGGYGDDYSSFYNGTGCNPGGNDVVFYPNQASNGNDSFGGFRPPFRLIDPYETYGGYVRANFIAGSPNMIRLQWKYLPGTAPGVGGSPLAGSDVIYKVSANGGSGGGGDESCDDYLKNKGYNVAGNVTTALGQYDYSSGVLVANNLYQYQFAICPYTLSNGIKKYVGEMAQSGCVGGNCNSGFENYGWGVADLTVTMSNTADVALGVHMGAVTATESTSSELYTSLAITSGSTSQEFSNSDNGSEVLLQVMAMGSNGDCGSYQGNMIQVGQRAFGRILFGSASIIKVARGTFVDDLSNTYTAATATSANFCTVHATKVAHFRNLNLASTIEANPFSYTNAGGVIPIRVSGFLNMSGAATISGLGRGYGGGSTSLSGSGVRKQSSAVAAAGNSGGAYLGGSGAGGGAGAMSFGGTGTNSASLLTGGVGGVPVSNGGNYGASLLLGSGGGGNGGAGGGAALIMSRYIHAASGAAVVMDGQASLGPSYGGGGGGTVNIVAERIVGNLALGAAGSNGGTAGISQGGAGGGGQINQFVCLAAIPTTTNAQAGSGPVATGAGGGAGPGQVNIFNSATAYNPACVR